MHGTDRSLRYASHYCSGNLCFIIDDKQRNTEHHQHPQPNGNISDAATMAFKITIIDSTTLITTLFIIVLAHILTT